MTLSYSARVLAAAVTDLLSETRDVESVRLAPYYDANPVYISDARVEESAGFRDSAGLPPISDVVVAQFSGNTSNQSTFIDYAIAAGIEQVFADDLSKQDTPKLPSSTAVSKFIDKYQSKFGGNPVTVTTYHLLESDPIIYADDIAEINTQLLKYAEYVRYLTS